jgi:hypothetical protein
MSSEHKHEIPIELSGIVERLENERPRLTDLESDRIKLRAIAGASRRTRGSRPGRRQFRRSGRLASVALAIVLVGGGGAVFAKQSPPSSGAAPTSASSTQYCPPSSPAPGKPKTPGPSKCGH